MAEKGLILEQTGNGKRAALWVVDDANEQKTKISALYTDDKEIRLSGLEAKYYQTYGQHKQNTANQDRQYERFSCDDVLEVTEQRDQVRRLDYLLTTDGTPREAAANLKALDLKCLAYEKEINVSISQIYAKPIEASAAWSKLEHQRQRAGIAASEAYAPSKLGEFSNDFKRAAKGRKKDKAARELEKLNKMRVSFARAADDTKRIKKRQQERAGLARDLERMKLNTGNKDEVFKLAQSLKKVAKLASKRLSGERINKHVQDDSIAQTLLSALDRTKAEQARKGRKSMGLSLSRKLTPSRE